MALEAPPSLLDELYQVQVQLTFPIECCLYEALTEWHAARTVVDLGTGNGCYLRKLAQRFPEKTYLGVDTNSALVARARAEDEVPQVAYAVLDFRELEGTYDFAIGRALVQHLEEVATLNEWLQRHIAVGGGVLIIDRDDESSISHEPPLPEFERLYAEVSKRQRESRTDDSDPLLQLQSIFTSSGQSPSERRIVIDSAGDRLRLIEHQHALVLSLLLASGWPKDQIANVRDALARWAQLPGRSATLGMKAVYARF